MTFDSEVRSLEVSTSKDVLERIRPTVVVRRRRREEPAGGASDVAATAPATAAANSDDEAPPSLIFGHPDVDADSPPSSIFLHPGYNAIAATDEEEPDTDPREEPLALEHHVTADTTAAPPPPSRKEFHATADMTVTTVAKRLGVSPMHIVDMLVRGGLFQTTLSASLSADALRLLADAYRLHIVGGPTPSSFERISRVGEETHRMASKARSARKTGNPVADVAGDVAKAAKGVAEIAKAAVAVVLDRATRRTPGTKSAADATTKGGPKKKAARKVGEGRKVGRKAAGKAKRVAAQAKKAAGEAKKAAGKAKKAVGKAKKAAGRAKIRAAA